MTDNAYNGNPTCPHCGISGDLEGHKCVENKAPTTDIVEQDNLFGKIEVLQMDDAAELWQIAIHDGVQWVSISDSMDVCDAHEMAAPLKKIVEPLRAKVAELEESKEYLLNQCQLVNDQKHELGKVLDRIADPKGFLSDDHFTADAYQLEYRIEYARTRGGSDDR